MSWYNYVKGLTQGQGFMSHSKERDGTCLTENMEIVSHRPSNPGFEPATFQSQV